MMIKNKMKYLIQMMYIMKFIIIKNRNKCLIWNKNLMIRILIIILNNNYMTKIKILIKKI